MARRARFLSAALVLAATVLLAAGIFGPCLKIFPGFGDYAVWVRMLKPDLTEPTSFSLFGGIAQLARGGNWLLAGVVFSFSVIFPLAKLTVYWAAAVHGPAHRSFQRTVDGASLLGRFSMVDVFAIALLVVAIKGLPGGTQVRLQWAFWCFCGAILLSLAIPFALKRSAERASGEGGGSDGSTA